MPSAQDVGNYLVGASAIATLILAGFTARMAAKTGRAAVAAEREATAVEEQSKELIKQVQATNDQAAATTKQAQAVEAQAVELKRQAEATGEQARAAAEQLELTRQSLELAAQPWLTLAEDREIGEDRFSGVVTEPPVVVVGLADRLSASLALRRVFQLDYYRPADATEPLPSVHF